jgi:mannose-6-phosphate isomerase
MKVRSLYPLRFEPIYQYRPWGGRRLGALLSAPLPAEGPIGEAWVLSDRDEHPSRVAEGFLRGMTIRQLLEQFAGQLLGRLSERCTRFPLLLKFLDVSKRLSVQVHPSDAYQELTAGADTGKTEAWVVLQGGPDARVYAGLKPPATAEALRRALTNGTVAEQLASFTPKSADAVLIPAGIVHSLRDVVVFEVQQSSDVTFRLYDWDQLDPRTGQGRLLQVEQALACIDFQQGAIGPVIPLAQETGSVLRERLVDCEYFGVTRISGRHSFVVGAAGRPRVLVCLSGGGQVEHAGTSYALDKGVALLLPAAVGACSCQPHDFISLLEVSLREAYAS